MKAKKGGNMTLKQRLTLISLSLTTVLLFSAIESGITRQNNLVNSNFNPYDLESLENSNYMERTLLASKEKPINETLIYSSTEICTLEETKDNSASTELLDSIAFELVHYIERTELLNDHLKQRKLRLTNNKN